VDHQKLDWINKHHILKRAETQEGLNSLVDILKPFVNKSYHHLEGTQQAYRLGNEYLAQVINTIKERIRNISDIPHLCSYYFENPNYTTPDALALKKKLKQSALGMYASS
jgi:glutamyl/glutaminyl-tRNA synthetase